MNPRSYMKAILAAAAVALASGLANAMADGNLTGPEVVASLGLGISGGLVVYRVPNTPPPGQDPPPPVDWS